jgi:hypothetical protein
MRRKAKTVNPYLVFVSHSAKDRWIAGQMSGQIEAKGRKCGIKTFLDEKDIQGGDPISQSIRKSLQSCAEFVVLLTRNSINRPWVLIEIGAA